MAKRKPRYTKHDAAIFMYERMEKIRLCTTDAVVYGLAEEGSMLASNANEHLGHAAYYDQSTGGGSGKAWSHRSKASRFMTKAKKVMEEIERRGASLANFRMPSIDNIRFLRKVSDSNGSVVALMVDQDRTSPCRDAKWLELRDVVGGSFWDLTPEGRAILETHGHIADVLNTEACQA